MDRIENELVEIQRRLNLLGGSSVENTLRDLLGAVVEVVGDVRREQKLLWRAIHDRNQPVN